jgi:glycosyltransferase involved in cell wall biosynthesis
VKILHLDLGRGMRGGQRQVLYLMRRLAAAPGVETLLAAPRGCPLGTAARAAGLDVHDLPGRQGWDPRALWALRALVRRRGVDVIHTHCAASALLGALLKGLTGARLVHSRRVSYPLRPGPARAKYLAGDAVACVSREIARVMARCGVPEARLSVIHSGIDPALYAAAAATPPPECPVLGVVGALTPQKGVAVFLEALAELERRAPGLGWRALVVGDGPLGPGLRARAEALGLAGRVTFTGWRESAAVLGELSVLAVPSVDGEGSSATIKEGWAARRPVVCSDLPSNLELVEPGHSGLACPRGDAPALAAALERLCAPGGQGAALAEALVRGGAGRLELFTEAAMARGYLELYARLSA